VQQADLDCRSDSRHADQAAAQIDMLLSLMARHCCQPPHRLIRCDDPTMWMEIYQGIVDFAAFVAALDTVAGSLNCAAFTLGERHLECFIPPESKAFLADPILSPP